MYDVLVLVGAVLGLAGAMLFRRFLAALQEHNPSSWQALGAPTPRPHGPPDMYGKPTYAWSDLAGRWRTWQYVLGGGYRTTNDPELIAQGTRLRLLLVAFLFILALAVVLFAQRALASMHPA